MLSKKKVLLYGFCYIFIFLFIVCFFYYFFGDGDISSYRELKENSFHKSLQIIVNNMTNFLGYVFLYPIYPFFIFLDFVFSSWAISISLKLDGLAITLDNLLPHALLEIPVHILYTYMSFMCFKQFYKKRNSIKDIFVSMYNHKRVYYVCILFIIISGLLEGLVT